MYPRILHQEYSIFFWGTRQSSTQVLYYAEHPIKVAICLQFLFALLDIYCWDWYSSTDDDAQVASYDFMYFEINKHHLGDTFLKVCIKL